ncbi:MAG: hypothetical protein ABH811_02840 [archaeon]
MVINYCKLCDCEGRCYWTGEECRKIYENFNLEQLTNCIKEHESKRMSLEEKVA